MQTGKLGPRPELVGDAIGQILLDTGGVQLLFERARISMWTDLRAHAPHQSTNIDPYEHSGDLSLLWGRLQAPVKAVEVVSRGVVIEFEDGWQLSTSPENLPYENGVIDYLRPGALGVF